MKGLQDQISSLRTEQITAYEQLLNQFLTNQVRNRIVEIKKEITPGKIVEQISPEINPTAEQS